MESSPRESQEDMQLHNDRILFPFPGMQLYRGHVYLPFEPPSLLEQVANFKMLPGDILYSTYPRSATPFLSEIMWLLYNEIDLATARCVRQGARVRFMEHLLAHMNPIEHLGATDPPRLLKTHLAATFFEDQIQTSGIKAIVMLRDPKDVLVSLYKFYKEDPGYLKFPGGWDEYFDIFKAKQLIGGDWFDHTQSWLKFKDLKNVLMLRYEEIREDPTTHVAQIARFCDKSVSEDDIDKIVKYVMDEVPEACVTGEWRGYFSGEQERYVDTLMGETSKATGVSF